MVAWLLQPHAKLGHQAVMHNGQGSGGLISIAARKALPLIPSSTGHDRHAEFMSHGLKCMEVNTMHVPP